jgi:hypothetical protein
MMGDKDNNVSKRKIRFAVICLSIFIFFSAHNYMQELIMSLPGFQVLTYQYIYFIYIN